MYADPDAPVFRRIRAGWPGVLIADPVLGEELSTDAVRRASERLPARR
ncbi:hypothetical protein [Streptomyces pactum]